MRRALLLVVPLWGCTTTTADVSSSSASSSSSGSTSGAASSTAGTSGASFAASSSAGATSTAAGTSTAGTSARGSSVPASSSTAVASSSAGASSASPSSSSSGGSCPVDTVCVSTFPFHLDGDTALSGTNTFNTYNCAPNTNEGGPEVVFQVTVPANGFLSAAVYDGAGVDVDVHILSGRDAQTCVDRGDRHARADVTAGTWWVVVDTYVSGGTPQVGAFGVDIGFLAPSVGPCDMETGVMPRVNDGGNNLAMPATGPVVLEAHLVTQEEPQPYPATATDELDAHYALSQARTGLVMYRSQVWAPLEGGSFYGAGIGSPTLFPVEHEGWYVNMYWTAAARPARGTRMIVREPGGNRAVVVAAGYETGPGNLAHIGGTPEETHFYMGTGHLDVMTLGVAVDQQLPFGPRTCQ